MRGRAFAWLNLAARFLVHVARMPLRPFSRNRGYDRFLRAVGTEGYRPLTPGERAEFPSFMNCVSCGLCSLACPVLRDAPASAWEEAWTFVIGASRSIDRAELIAVAPPLCARCEECADVCPADIPIPRLAALAERLAAP